MNKLSALIGALAALTIVQLLITLIEVAGGTQ